MNPKNNGFWDDAMGEMNEKFVAEAAEAHAKSVAKNQLDSEGAVDAGAPIVIAPAEKKPMSRKRLFITIGSIAAAMVLCVGIGGVLINRFADPITPVTSGDGTSETSETEENSDNSDNNDDNSDKNDNQGTAYVHPPIDTNFDGAVIRNDEDKDSYMWFNTDHLKEAIVKFKDSEPLTDGSTLEPYSEHVSVELYADKEYEGEYDIIKLFVYNGTNDTRYYYGISSAAMAPYFTYYEVYFDDWVELLGVFGEVPMVMQTTVTENNGDGTYVVKHEKGGQTYLIATEEQYEIGDEIDVCYYGMPLGEEPFQTEVLWTRYSYNIEEDTSPVWREEGKNQGVNWNIFEQYFVGEWTKEMNPKYQFILSYPYDEYGGIDITDFKVTACYALDDGYYLEYEYSGGFGMQYQLLFISDRDMDTMHKYIRYWDQDTFDNQKNSPERTTLQRVDNSSYSEYTGLQMYSYLGTIGRQRFGVLMGEEYVEFSKQFDEDFVDNKGRRWRLPTDLPIRQNLSYYLKEYSDTKDKVVIVQNYVRADTATADSEPEDAIYQYVTSVAQKIDGEWQMTERYLSDFYGRSINDVLAETVYGDFSIFTSYHIDEGAVSDAKLYITTRDDTDTKLSEAQITNPKMTNGAVQLPVHIYENFTIATGEQELNSGDLAIVRIPYEQNGEIRYSYTLYNTTPEGKLVLIEGAFPDSAHSRWMPDIENNTISFLSDEGVDIYKIDFSTNTMALVDYIPEITDDYTLDTAISKADPGLEGFGVGAMMFGWWGNSDTRICISNYSKDMFDYDDPCLGWYTDDNGVYMLGRINGAYQLWYMPGSSARDSYVLFRYDDVTEGEVIKLSDYDECYQRLNDNSSPYTDYGENGYIGMMEYCAKRDIKVNELKLEITDDSGTRWARVHSDLQIEWGYFIETNVNGERAVQMKFLNPETGEMRWLTLPYDFDWRGYYYTGEVYFLDPALSSTDTLKTELSTQAKLSVDQSLWGTFLIDEQYLTRNDDKYYGIRHMGSNMAQWLGNSELFFYDGSEWKLISDKFGLCHALAVGDKLYVLRNDYGTQSEDIWLNVYTGTELNHEIRIGEGHTNYSGISVIDGYIVVGITSGTYIYRPEAINADPIVVNYPHFTSTLDGHFTVIIDGIEYNSADGLPASLFG